MENPREFHGIPRGKHRGKSLFRISPGQPGELYDFVLHRVVNQ
jgi:hypothetical protein